jgi:putative PEP-CTERM system histidine kinase
VTTAETLATPILIGALSAALGALGHSLLAVLLALAGRSSPQGRALLAVAVSSALWLAAMALLLPVPLAVSAQAHAVVAVAEWWRGLAWLVFLLTLMPRREHDPVPAERWSRWIILLAVVGAVLLLTLPVSYAGEASRSLCFLLLLLSLANLVLLEQVLRNTPSAGWWGIKFFVISLAALSAYDFFLYAQAVLLRHVDSQLWLARGTVNALVAPLLALGVRRNPEWRLKIYVSREVVFHSSTLLGAGFYLLSMGIAGYWVREAGGTWGQFLQTTFWFAGLVTMALALSSGELRSRLRVLLAKHFYRNKYEYREEWLKLTHTLAGAPADVTGMAEGVVEGVSSLIEAQGAALWLRDDSGCYVLRVRRSLDLGDDCGEALDAAHPLPAFLMQSGWVVLLDEWRDDPSRYPGLALPPWLLASASVSLVVPLLARDNLVGFLLLGRSRGGRRFDWEDIDLLKAVGRQTAGHLALALTTDALARSRQFEAYHRLSAFLVHDLKNVVAQLSLLTRNAERHADNPEFVSDAFATVGHAVDRMKRMLANLKAGENAPTTRRSVDLGRLVSRMLARLPVREPEPRWQSPAEPVWVHADPEALTTALEHLVQNAQEATEDSGRVSILLERAGSEVILCVADSGAGMDPTFLAERLFKPFDTTKGNAGMGIGAFESRELIIAMGGRLDVTSRPGEGSEFRIRLPCAEAQHDSEASGT